MTHTGVITVMANSYSALTMFQTLYRENILQKPSPQQVLPTWGAAFSSRGQRCLPGQCSHPPHPPHQRKKTFTEPSSVLWICQLQPASPCGTQMEGAEFLLWKPAGAQLCLGWAS